MERKTAIIAGIVGAAVFIGAITGFVLWRRAALSEEEPAPSQPPVADGGGAAPAQPSAPAEPAFPDRDQDGVSDEEEVRLGTDPDVTDTDGDGLIDGTEITKTRTDPRKYDTDGDGRKDGAELRRPR